MNTHMNTHEHAHTQNMHTHMPELIKASTCVCPSRDIRVGALVRKHSTRTALRGPDVEHANSTGGHTPGPPGQESPLWARRGTRPP
jgi:hypothetical protein